MQRVWKLVAIGAMAMLASGCAGAKRGERGPDGAASSGSGGQAVVNAWCATDPAHAVSADKRAPRRETRMWRGQRIGFCSDACAKAWDEIKDEQRSAALGAAIKREQTDGRPTADQPPTP